MFVVGVAWAGQDANLLVNVNKDGRTISPRLYGIFIEEFSRMIEGGLFAEMVQNRSFEDSSIPLAWTFFESGGARGRWALDASRPLNANNSTSLRLDITGAQGGRVGVFNEGFKGAPIGDWHRWTLKEDDPATWTNRFADGKKRFRAGIAVTQGKSYRLSMYARCSEEFAGPLTASIETKDGRVLAARPVSVLQKDWKQFTVQLDVSKTEPDARLVISATMPGVVWLDMVSLFPAEVSVERPFRPDLLAMLKQMQPSVLRFPGGCHVEGPSFRFAYHWKPTLGDPAARDGWWKKEGYYNGNGIGMHEYLLLSEELGAEPVYVLNCGMGDRWVGTPEEIKVFVQDGLDAIEYMIGPVDSVWGKRRAEAGHPAPFRLRTVEIGNENGGSAYAERYPVFRDAIRARYPHLELVQNDVVDKTGSIIDHHYYISPESLLDRSTMYDQWDRKGNKVMVGEYAVGRLGDLRAALAEAAFMTGMERNSDVVIMASFAPLIGHIGWLNWGQHGILVDAAEAVATPSWHVQTMFGRSTGDKLLPIKLDGPMMLAQEPFEGRIAVGTIQAQAEFKDLRVTRGAEILHLADFSVKQDAGQWKSKTGSWDVKHSVLRQESIEKSTLAVFEGFGHGVWTSCAIGAKVRKMGGPGGLKICFGDYTDTAHSWWQLGGADNNAHVLSLQNKQCQPVDGHLENGRWYDVRIDISCDRIRCYLDNVLIHDVPVPKLSTLYAVASKKTRSGEIIIKVVNMAEQPAETILRLEGVKRLSHTGIASTLSSGSFSDTNSMNMPDKVVPCEAIFPVAGREFVYSFPARSLSILRIQDLEAQ